MKIYKNPSQTQWDTLCKRPTFDTTSLTRSVDQIMQTVAQKGDSAVLDLTRKFDGVALKSLVVTTDEIQEQAKKVSTSLGQAIKTAAANIKKFHKAQIQKPEQITTTQGVVCWRKQLPIQRVGLYVPGGTAPLFSSLLMLAIPAKLAGCPQIVITTPPNEAGSIAPEIAYCCKLLGLNSVFKAGGVQAIAAMTFGTDSVPKVDKLFGPGNQYVTRAKQLALDFGLAIDMPAGPSEVLIIADSDARPDFVAADLLSQAEHGKDSQVILLSDNLKKLQGISEEVQNQLAVLPRSEFAKAALANSKALFFDSINQCVDFSNTYAPEHLILAVSNPKEVSERITAAGSVFLGAFTPESAGDYASGTNHTLPTNGYARQYSGVSLDSFVNMVTFQQMSKEGLENLGPVIEKLAEAEGLQAHKNAVSIRLKALSNES